MFDVAACLLAFAAAAAVAVVAAATAAATPAPAVVAAGSVDEHVVVIQCVCHTVMSPYLAVFAVSAVLPRYRSQAM